MILRFYDGDTIKSLFNPLAIFSKQKAAQVPQTTSGAGPEAGAAAEAARKARVAAGARTGTRSTLLTAPNTGPTSLIKVGQNKLLGGSQ